ncbi:MAG: dihydroneopterin aldolase [Anaerolineales bacterium]|nr:dihydroneopterin aldolase [Anaerolineales bacterium]
MTDKILISDLREGCIIGVHAWERQAPQEVVINIELTTATRRAARSDDIADCIDYDALTREVSALVKRVQRFTVEALAEDIADLCLHRSGVRRVRVRVEKPGAVPRTGSVGVEIER